MSLDSGMESCKLIQQRIGLYLLICNGSYMLQGADGRQILAIDVGLAMYIHLGWSVKGGMWP